MPRREQIEFREIVELFLYISIYELKSESEVPNINFKFGPDGYALFKSIVEKPFELEGSWTPNATQENIDFLIEHSNDPDCLTIQVKSSIRFFRALMNITNSLLELYKYYDINDSPRHTAMNLMRRIWLRMGVNDVENIEQFLEKQLEFVNNRSFDQQKPTKISSYLDCDINMKTMVNRTFDETTRSMIFTITSGEEEYELPHILYDIDDKNTCYVYGVQSKGEKKSKVIERKLYKLNKGIEDPNVHPSKVCALLTFIKFLQKRGIKKIVVPGLQVLSYRYHELLSKDVEKELTRAEVRLADFPHRQVVIDNYKAIKDWYNKLHEKQDFISFLKTEELFNLTYRMTEQDPSIEITNDVAIQGDSINMNI